MLIKKLNIINEFFLYLLLFGITFSNAFVEICVGFLIFIFLIRKAAKKELLPPKTPINLALCIFSLIIFVSFLRSAYFDESVRGVARIIKYVMLFFSVTDFLNQDKKYLKRFFWAVVYISGFSFLNGIFQNIFGFDILRHHHLDKLDYLHRINGSFVHPNDFGAYIISVLPLTFTFFSKELSAKRKVILLITSVLGLYCLFATSSRGALLGFLIGAFFFLFYYKKKIAILAPLIIVLYMIFSPHGMTRITNIFSWEKNTVWERTQLWKGTWNMVKERPILGFGINTFSEYFPKYKPVDYPDLRYTHNSYLQMWSEIGIVGLLVFLAIVLTIIISVCRNLKNKSRTGVLGIALLSLMAGYIAFLVQSGVDTNLYSLVLLTQFWVMNACLLSLNKFLDGET